MTTTTLGVIYFLLFFGCCVLALYCIQRTKNRPMAKIKFWAAVVRWISQRRMQRDMGWRTAWNHIRNRSMT
jgi:hypothetical protein